MTTKTKKSNVNVSVNDGLYYIHYDDVNVYQSKNDPSVLVSKKEIPQNKEDEYVLNLEKSQEQYNTWLQHFTTAMMRRFRSYKKIDTYLKTDRRLVLQNKMFCVIIENNDWSFAVELISLPNCPYKVLQRHLFPTFLSGMREILFSLNDTIYVRNGSWSAKPITRNTEHIIDQNMKAGNMRIDPKQKATCAENKPTTRPEPKPKTYTILGLNDAKDKCCMLISHIPFRAIEPDQCNAGQFTHETTGENGYDDIDRTLYLKNMILTGKEITLPAEMIFTGFDLEENQQIPWTFSVKTLAEIK